MCFSGLIRSPGPYAYQLITNFFVGPYQSVRFICRPLTFVLEKCLDSAFKEALLTRCSLFLLGWFISSEEKQWSVLVDFCAKVTGSIDTVRGNPFSSIVSVFRRPLSVWRVYMFVAATYCMLALTMLQNYCHRLTAVGYFRQGRGRLA